MAWDAIISTTKNIFIIFLVPQHRVYKQSICGSDWSHVPSFAWARIWNLWAPITGFVFHTVLSSFSLLIFFVFFRDCLARVVGIFSLSFPKYWAGLGICFSRLAPLVGPSLFLCTMIILFTLEQKTSIEKEKKINDTSPINKLVSSH